MDPFGMLPTPPDVELVALESAEVAFNPWPSAQIVRPLGDGPADVAAVVEAARAAARERGKTVLAWLITREHDHLVPALEAAGIANADTPGFEAIENALALVSPPPGSRADGVEIGVVETWEEWRETGEVARTVFGHPEMDEDYLRERYAQYAEGRDRGIQLFAAVDGRIVGSGYAAFGDAAINLFGAAVLPEARGRGVYRSLVHARWELAAERGTPALTIQAGRMARPICERMGFVLVGIIRVFVDELG
jgi:GNAT superfamily N-acetyltransferase